MSKIRRVSLHVDEPQPGHYFWVLMEEGDDESHWQEISSSKEANAMWLDALQEGMLALVILAGDERVGPRHTADDDVDDDSVGIPLS